MDIKADVVKTLRDKTGAGFMDCKGALVEAKGDFDKAIELLRIKGVAKAARKATRVAKDGMIYSYIHPGSKIGVLVEVNCETDFVARTDDFKNLVKDIAMHIAAASPRFLAVEDVPETVVAQERNIFEQQAKESGKPEKAWPKIVEGRIQKFYQEACLMEQPFVKDETKTIKSLMQESVAKIGENLSIRRYARFQVGEGVE